MIIRSSRNIGIEYLFYFKEHTFMNLARFIQVPQVTQSVVTKRRKYHALNTLKFGNWDIKIERVSDLGCSKNNIYLHCSMSP